MAEVEVAVEAEAGATKEKEEKEIIEGSTMMTSTFSQANALKSI